jgi:hypothetical protein
MHHGQINFLNASSVYHAMSPTQKKQEASLLLTNSATAIRLPVCMEHLQRRHQYGVVRFYKERKHGYHP